ncbi:hypothetical protein NV379_10680 [Paenibacillus sp. N1-5-1-14]|uniref:hypothetical protein n=1 Tax=Paenibacillus radicibacter TaxID=2972488 RepID=UPI0021593374|nr:hypothetical protein [Paenibacillus radicibacter]MCR8643124.1 hypothetical protein [Paenibacillus radicibacter]
MDFPWWDHADRDIKDFTIENIPLGSITDPYNDFEEGWQIIIYEKESFVYVLVGSSPSFSKKFYSWF